MRNLNALGDGGVGIRIEVALSAVKLYFYVDGNNNSNATNEINLLNGRLFILLGPTGASGVCRSQLIAPQPSCSQSSLDISPLSALNVERLGRVRRAQPQSSTPPTQQQPPLKLGEFAQNELAR